MQSPHDSDVDHIMLLHHLYGEYSNGNNELQPIINYYFNGMDDLVVRAASSKSIAKGISDPGRVLNFQEERTVPKKGRLGAEKTARGRTIARGSTRRGRRITSGVARRCRGG